jgi:hypothetical protein
MFCPTSGIPIAVYVDRINVDDRVWMGALVLQGKANLGEGRLASVSFDRGFWDGQELHQVAKEVPFFIPGRSDLGITKEARRMASAAYERYQKGLPVHDAVVATRAVTVATGRGKDRREEPKELIVLGIQDLDCDTYAAEPPESQVNSKSFVAHTLNAAVVMEDGSGRHGCESGKVKVLPPSVACIRRLACPKHAPVTMRELLGCKSHGCPVSFLRRSGRGDLGGEQTRRPERKE